MSKKHPGFAAVQSSIAKKSGVSSESAGAILATASRGASHAAKKDNPRLKRVKGKMHTGGYVPSDGAYEMLEGEKVIPASVKTGSQFNHPKKEVVAPKPTEDNARQKFDGTGDPAGSPKGGDCHCISPDGIIKRDKAKRFAF